MVMDDDPTTVDYLVEMSKDNGYETCFVYDAGEGFEVLQREKPDLITLPLRALRLCVRKKHFGRILNCQNQEQNF